MLRSITRLISTITSKLTSPSSKTLILDPLKISYSMCIDQSCQIAIVSFAPCSYRLLIVDHALLRYNNDNVGTEGGMPNIQPAFASGQDDFLASLATQGKGNE